MRSNLRLPTRLLVCVAAVAGTASLAAVAVPSVGSATANSVDGELHEADGNQTTQKITGCSGTGKAQTGTTGTTKVASNDKSATITWATKKTSIETFTLQVDRECVPGRHRLQQAIEVQ